MKKMFFAVLLGYSSQALAYLDPGSASLFIQGLIAAIASGVTIISLFWTKLKSFFLRKPDNDGVDASKKEDRSANESGTE